jgi:SAM-dependent methyltransferase
MVPGYLGNGAQEPGVDCCSPSCGDAMGDMLRAAWATGAVRGRCFEVVERSDARLEVGDASRYFDAPDRWPKAERAMLDWTRGNVLDVGCGAGRHALALMAAGHRVTGLDPSPGAAAVAAERGVEARQADVLHIDASLGSFETAIMMGSNLALLGGKKTAPQVFRALSSVLQPDGVIIGTCIDPYHFTSDDDESYMRDNLRRHRMAGQLRIRVRYGSTSTPWFDYLFMSLDELSMISAAAGWAVVRSMLDGPFYCAMLQRSP